MHSIRLGVLGGTSLVGRHLLNLLSLQSIIATAYTRQNTDQSPVIPGITWQQLDTSARPEIDTENTVDESTSLLPRISLWISVAPIWVLSNHFNFLKLHGAQRIVALSSTSLFVKDNSSNADERSISLRLSQGEESLKTWAEANGIEWIILRPTLIYGGRKDKNISEIANFIERFGFFPVFGRASGLRQPVYAGDVAAACLSALQQPAVVNHAYNISGGETLTYHQMVTRIFSTLGLRSRILHVPLFFFRIVIYLLHLIPRYRNWSVEMAERMNQDLCFDHSSATRDFAYLPRNFVPFAEK